MSCQLHGDILCGLHPHKGLQEQAHQCRQGVQGYRQYGQIYNGMVLRLQAAHRGYRHTEQYEKRADGDEGQDPSTEKIGNRNDKRPAQEHLPGRTFAPPQLRQLFDELRGEPCRLIVSRKKTWIQI